MALIENHETVAPHSDIRPKPAPLPVAVMEKLSRLHVENALTLRRTEFLRATVNIALAQILLGGALLLFIAGASLKDCFIWSLLVLLGIGGLLRCHIQASSSRQAGPDSLDTNVRDMRAVLLYAGFAWGAGALLVLPPMSGPVAVLSFTALPSLVVALLLKDRDGILAFLLPLTVIGVTAAILNHRPFAGLDTALLLMLQSGIAAYTILRARRRETLPSGLFVRP